MLATLTSKGQITIPAAIRQELGLKPRDRLDFVLQGDAITVRRIKNLRDFRGSIANPESRSVDELREEARQALATRVIEEME